MSNIQSVRISNNEGFATLISCIKEIRDPRIKRKQQHPFVSIVVLAICAVIGGANSWVAIAEFGNNHKEWFIEFLDLPNGIPSHDTFNRVFGLINNKELMQWLWIWLENLCEINDNQIAIDGKIVKAWNSKNPLTILRACGSQSKLILGQIKVRSDSNEITAIPEMLNILYLKGKIITIDAIGTQKHIAQLIIAKEADYVLPIKKNQFYLYENVKLFLDDMSKDLYDNVYYTFSETEDYGHGRHEIRRCWATDSIDWFDKKNLWPNLKSLTVIESVRSDKNKTSISRRYYISSLPADARRLLSIIRNHWSIENGPHWAMDLVFEEDRSTSRTGTAPQNFALLRSFSYSLLRYEKSKNSLRAKRARANSNFDYLAKELLNMTI